MKDFYISKVGATGPGVGLSEVDLKDGVNIIHGPSNTGKSMVIDAIDYLLGGSEPPLDPSSTGYDSVHMVMTGRKGSEITFRRKISVDNGNPKSDSIVRIESTWPEIETGDYSTGSKGKYNEQVLKLLEIPTPVQIIKTQEEKPQNLTFRTFSHQFFLKEDTICTKKTIIDNPKHSAITSCLTSLMYLIDERGTAEKEFESTEVKEAKKKAVQDYISKKFKYIEGRNAELRELLEATGGADPEERIEQLLLEISETQRAISEADAKSRTLASNILSESTALQEAEFLQNRYDMLRSQYESDRQRLSFILDGETSVKEGYADNCPFCSNPITETEKRERYTSAAMAEMQSVESQLRELGQTQDELSLQIREHKDALERLGTQKREINSLVEGSFKPHMDELNEMLEQYRRISTLKTELDTNMGMYELFNYDYNYEEARETKAEKYDAKEEFDPDAFAKLAVLTSDTIRDCGYTDFGSASISKITYDVVVNGKHKKNNGKGYRAFLNSSFAFALMKFLEKEARHAPMMLVLDSPILTLKENIDDEASAGMKAGLFQHIVSCTGSCQVIIAENTIPTVGVDYRDANLIQFTRDDNHGRYGFLVSHK